MFKIIIKNNLRFCNDFLNDTCISFNEKNYFLTVTAMNLTVIDDQVKIKIN